MLLSPLDSALAVWPAFLLTPCAPVRPGLSVSAKHISGGMAGLRGDLCVPSDLAKTQLQNQCGQETDKGMHVGAGMCIGVWGPRRLGLGWAAAYSPWTR